MSTNEKFRVGNKVSLPVPSGTTAGSPLRIGGLNGVAATDRAKTDVDPYNADGSINSSYNRGGGNVDGNASVWLDGAHDVPVGTTTALAIGDPVYITSGNALTPVSTSNSLFGHALSVKGTTAGETVTVRITN
jgi:hypothetical protein